MKLYTVITTEFALDDLKLGQHFYELQAPQLGDYFFDSLVTDIKSLHIYAGIHLIDYGYYKMLSKRFPYVIYYETFGSVARVISVLDQRKSPMSNYKQLSQR